MPAPPVLPSPPCRYHPQGRHTAAPLSNWANGLRWVAGILLNRHGQRFGNELGKRDYLTGRIMDTEGRVEVAWCVPCASWPPWAG